MTDLKKINKDNCPLLKRNKKFADNFIIIIFLTSLTYFTKNINDDYLI